MSAPEARDAAVIRSACRQCGKKLKTDAGDAGRKAACHKCGAKMTVPSASAPLAELTGGLAIALAA